MQPAVPPLPFRSHSLAVPALRLCRRLPGAQLQSGFTVPSPLRGDQGPPGVPAVLPFLRLWQQEGKPQRQCLFLLVGWESGEAIFVVSTRSY